MNLNLSFSIKVAVREMRRHAMTYATIVGCLAIGIGVCVVMAGVLDQLLLLTPKGIGNVNQLRRVFVSERAADQPERFGSSLGYRDLVAIQRSSRSIEIAAASEIQRVVTRRGQNIEQATISLVSPEYFATMQTRATHGRLFGKEIDRPGDRLNVAVVSDQYLKRTTRLGEEIVGTSIIVGTASVTVIGVTSEHFSGTGGEVIDMWIPIESNVVASAGGMQWKTNGSYWLQIFARIKPGVAEATASRELAAIVASEHAQGKTPLITDVRFAGMSAGSGPDKSRQVNISVWLGVMSVVVLFVAWANSAGLLVLLALQRTQAIGIRIALGAGPRWILQYVLVEGFVVATASCVGALVFAVVLNRVFAATIPASPAFQSTAIDAHRLIVLGVLTIATVTISAIAPALMSLRVQPSVLLSSGTMPRTRLRARRMALVVAQVATMVPMVVGAVLFGQSMSQLVLRQSGLDAERVLYGDLGSRTSSVGAADEQRALRAVSEQAKQIPGVTHSSIANNPPLRSAMGMSVYADDDSRQFRNEIAYYNAVSREYLQTLGTRILVGRNFEASDIRGSERVAVINEQFARLYWRTNHVGQCVWLGSPDGDCARIVGIVQNTITMGLTSDVQPLVFIPIEQNNFGTASFSLLVRFDGNSARVIQPLQRMLRDAVPGAPFAKVTLLADIVAPYMTQWKLGAWLFRTFSFLAIAMASAGIYALISQLVARRRNEVAIRMALGASNRNIALLFLRLTAAVAASGVAAGLVASLVGARFVGDVLYKTSAYNWVPYAIASLVPIVICALATARPISVAAGTQPSRVLGISGQ